MTSAETVIPEALTSLAEALESNVTPLLEQAKASFEAAEIEGEAFSRAGIAMQIVYPGTREWALKDCETKNEELTAIHDKLTATANIWSRAEGSNTMPGIELV